MPIGFPPARALLGSRLAIAGNDPIAADRGAASKQGLAIAAMMVA
jgi:hypothetical protein